MKIKNLKISNFKGIEKYEIDEVQQLEVFLGDNGTGKTSILDAVRFLLTGKAPNNFVRNVEQPSFVEGEIGDVGVIQRGIKRGKSFCTLNGKSVTQKALAEFLSKVYAVSADTMGIATSSDVLREMFGGDFSKYLLTEGYMNMDIPQDDFFALCGFSETAQGYVEEELMGADVGIEDVNRMYAVFKEQLKQKKKDISDLEAQIKAYDGGVPEVAEEVIAQLVKDAQEKLVAAKSSVETYKRQSLAYQNGLESIKTLDAKIASISVRPVNIELRQEKEKAIVEKRTAYITATGSVKTLQESIGSISDLIARLDTPICPISGKLVCTTDKTPIKNELIMQMDKTNSELTALLATVSDMKSSGQQLASEVKELLENERLAAERDKLVAQKKGLESALQKPAPVENMIEKCELEYREAIAERDKVVAYKYHCGLKEKLESAKMMADTYKEIVAKFEPKGAVAQAILSKAVDPLLDYCNEIADDIFIGKRLYFDVSNGFKVCLQNTDDEEVIVPFEGCSTGEKARMLLIVMNMINQLSGYNILILDNLDSLDKTSLEAVLRYIGSDNSYDHIFVAGIGFTEIKDAFSSADVSFRELS